MKQINKAVIGWLISGCLLVFLMVIVGGITRLTHSGLSMSDYKIITNVIPPIGDAQWQEAFELYKKYPEYQKINYLFSLEDFKSIYFWEWLHRLIGRLIGLVFIIPFVYFLFKKKLERPTVIKAILIGLLGAFQGFLGWYMVKSGLVDRPDVSHFRLAAHLVVAFSIFALTFWTILELIYKNKYSPKVINKPIVRWFWVGLIILFLQIIWGGFVAGLDAGMIHNHWPLMSEGKFMHQTVIEEVSPIILNFLKGRSGVQFIHRIGGFAVIISVFLIFLKSQKMTLNKLQARAVFILFGLVILQFLLGVFTLVFAVPLWLGLAHQIGAFLLLSSFIYGLFVFRKT